MGSIPENWKNLSGENGWKGLLDPITLNLRQYIIHYGERVQAAEDAFNSETKSKNYGWSRYAKKDFFSKVSLEIQNPYKYNVTKFIYAASGIVTDESNWIGYVAVATDEGKGALGRRDILVAWRGTADGSDSEFINDLQADLVSASDIFGENGLEPRIHHGWHTIYTSTKPGSPFNEISARDQVLAEVRRLVNLYKDEEISITVTGHSMGGAVGTLNAVDIACNGYNKSTGKDTGCPVTAFVFASPKVGDEGFKSQANTSKDVHILRISNKNDKVNEYPAYVPLFFPYVHVGEELAIDTSKSPYLNNKFPDLLTNSHNLEVYLHGVAGTHGVDGDFYLEVDRPLPLVNKHGDILLKDKYFIPANWWIEKNKGMVQQEDGSWLLMDREDDEDLNLSG